MLQEVLESVKQAEQQAHDLVAKAEEQAALTIKENQREIEGMWADAKEQAKSRRASVLSEAQLNADRQAEQIAEEYRGQCLAMREEGLAKVNDLVAYLTEIVFDGSC